MAVDQTLERGSDRRGAGPGRGVQGDVLLEIRGLRVEGQTDDVWQEIVKGIDLTVRRGEVLGLIGESGAGKSTIGLAAMGFVRRGLGHHLAERLVHRHLVGRNLVGGFVLAFHLQFEFILGLEFGFGLQLLLLQQG